MRIRIRGPEGSATIVLDPSATVANLRSEITTKTGLSAFETKHGYPPQPLNLDTLDDGVSLSDLGVKLDGEQLLITIRETNPDPLHSSGDPPQVSKRTPSPSRSPSASTQDPTTSFAGAPTTTRRPPSPTRDTPEIPVPTHKATLCLRVMPDDNSCLFRALGSAVYPGLDTMTELRSLIASTIRSNPSLYTAAILDKEPADYCAWITSDSSWGGAIELQILAEQSGVEIASINVQDGRVDRYNEGAANRCILVYSGIHYDVVALSPSVDPFDRSVLPPDEDVKVFAKSDEDVLLAATTLVAELRKRHYFTDTAKFALMCGQCSWKGHGEQEAVEHAKMTGHYDLKECPISE